MKSIQVIESHTVANEGSVLRLKAYLQDAGFFFSPPLEAEGNEAVFVLGIFRTGMDDEFWFKIGEACGKKKEVLLVTDSTSIIPRVAARLPTYRAMDSSDHSLLVKELCDLLGIVNIAVPRDPEDLANWLLMDSDRLRNLSASQLAILLKWIFSKAGHSFSKPTWVEEDQLVFEEPRTNIRYFMQCRSTTTKNSIIGLGDLHEFYARCAAAHVDVAVYVTNGRFSKSAFDWSSECVPSLRLLDQSAILEKLRVLINTARAPIAESASLAGPTTGQTSRARLRKGLIDERFDLMGGHKKSLIKFAFHSSDAKPEEIRPTRRPEGVKSYLCIISHAESELKEQLRERLKISVSTPVEVHQSSSSSLRDLTDLRDKATVWLVSPGFFSKSRSREDAIVLSYIAHLFNERVWNRPMVIFLSAGRREERLRVPTCFIEEAIWCPIEEFSIEDAPMRYSEHGANHRLTQKKL